MAGRFPRPSRVAFAKTAALVVLFAWAPLAWYGDIRATFSYLSSLTRFGKAPAVYAAILSLSFAGLIVTPFLRSSLARIPLVTLFLLSFAIDRVVVTLSSGHADASLVRTLWLMRSLTGQVMSAYGPIIVRHAAAIAGLGVLLAWPIRQGLATRY